MTIAVQSVSPVSAKVKRALIQKPEGFQYCTQARQACETLAERLKDVPEIQAVGLSYKSPVGLRCWHKGF
jgi:hypothetical protein